MVASRVLVISQSCFEPYFLPETSFVPGLVLLPGSAGGLSSASCSQDPCMPILLSFLPICLFLLFCVSAHCSQCRCTRVLQPPTSSVSKIALPSFFLSHPGKIHPTKYFPSCFSATAALLILSPENTTQELIVIGLWEPRHTCLSTSFTLLGPLSLPFQAFVFLISQSQSGQCVCGSKCVTRGYHGVILGLTLVALTSWSLLMTVLDL